MIEETAVQESSAAEVPVIPEMEVSRGPLVNLTPEQRKEYKDTGILPTSKAEESTTSSEPSASEAEPAGEPETPSTKQEKPKSKPKQTAEERIAQLESTIEKIKKGAGLEKPQAESAPAKIETKPAPVQTRQKPTPDDKNADGTDKYSTHDEYLEDFFDWKAEQKWAAKQAEEQQTAHAKALNAKIEEARSRYDNLDEVIQPAANELLNDNAISPVIKQMIGDSDVIVDLIFTLSNNKEEFASFVKLAKSDPGKAIRFIALTESLIAQELEGKKTPVGESPAKPRTLAPKPPAEAGGRAATPPDSLQAALTGSGGKLGRDLKAEFLRRDLAKLKG